MSATTEPRGAVGFSRGGRLVGLLLLLALGVVLYVDPGPVELVDASLQNSTTVVLYFERCNAEPIAKVQESPSAVVILVSTTEPGYGECLGAVTVHLEQPLDDRMIVDGATFHAINLRPVTGPDDDQPNP